MLETDFYKITYNTTLALSDHCNTMAIHITRDPQYGALPISRVQEYEQVWIGLTDEAQGIQFNRITPTPFFEYMGVIIVGGAVFPPLPQQKILTSEAAAAHGIKNLNEFYEAASALAGLHPIPLQEMSISKHKIAVTTARGSYSASQTADDDI